MLARIPWSSCHLASRMMGWTRTSRYSYAFHCNVIIYFRSISANWKSFEMRWFFVHYKASWVLYRYYPIRNWKWYLVIPQPIESWSMDCLACKCHSTYFSLGSDRLSFVWDNSMDTFSGIRHMQCLISKFSKSKKWVLESKNNPRHLSVVMLSSGEILCWKLDSNDHKTKTCYGIHWA